MADEVHGKVVRNEPSVVVSVIVYCSRRTVQPSGRRTSKGAVDIRLVVAAAESTYDLLSSEVWDVSAALQKVQANLCMGRYRCVQLFCFTHDIRGPASHSTMTLAFTDVSVPGDGT